MKIGPSQTLCCLALLSLFTGSAQAAQVSVLAKVTASGSYAVEVEVAQFANATSIDLVHPVFGPFALAFDSGESNWDVEAEDLTLAELGVFFDNTFNLEIDGGLSIYEAARTGPPGANDFPTPALGLSVVPGISPERPIASWSGGDGSADSMIITYASGDDEFGNGFEPAEANSSRSLNQDLAIGEYEVTLGFYDLLDPGALILLTGDDVLATDQFNLAYLGETFSSYTVVPVPGAVWLFSSALGLLGWMRRKRA